MCIYFMYKYLFIEYIWCIYICQNICIKNQDIYFFKSYTWVSYIFICVCIYISTYIYIYVHIYVFIYIYIPIQIYKKPKYNF